MDMANQMHRMRQIISMIHKFKYCQKASRRINNNNNNNSSITNRRYQWVINIKQYSKKQQPKNTWPMNTKVSQWRLLVTDCSLQFSKLMRSLLILDTVYIPMSQLLAYYRHLSLGQGSSSKSESLLQELASQAARQIPIPVYTSDSVSRASIYTPSKLSYQIQPQYVTYATKYPLHTQAILPTKVIIVKAHDFIVINSKFNFFFFLEKCRSALFSSWPRIYSAERVGLHTGCNKPTANTISARTHLSYIAIYTRRTWARKDLR